MRREKTFRAAVKNSRSNPCHVAHAAESRRSAELAATEGSPWQSEPFARLYNEDLAPANESHWGAFWIFNVWTSDVHSLWGYYLAASLFLLCGSFVNFVLAIGLGSLVIFS